MGQAVAGTNLFGQPVPTSFAQLAVERVELHLLYNGLVFIPMVVAMALHLRPPKEDLAKMTCSCAVHSPFNEHKHEHEHEHEREVEPATV